MVIKSISTNKIFKKTFFSLKISKNNEMMKSVSIKLKIALVDFVTLLSIYLIYQLAK